LKLLSNSCTSARRIAVSTATCISSVITAVIATVIECAKKKASETQLVSKEEEMNEVTLINTYFVSS